MESSERNKYIKSHTVVMLWAVLFFMKSHMGLPIRSSLNPAGRRRIVDT